MNSTVLITLIKKELSCYFHFIKVCIIVVRNVLQLYGQGTSSRKTSTDKRFVLVLRRKLGIVVSPPLFQIFSISQDMWNPS